MRHVCSCKRLELRSCPADWGALHDHLFWALPSLNQLVMTGADTRLNESLGSLVPSYKVSEMYNAWQQL